MTTMKTKVRVCFDVKFDLFIIERVEIYIYIYTNIRIKR